MDSFGGSAACVWGAAGLCLVVSCAERELEGRRPTSLVYDILGIHTSGTVWGPLVPSSVCLPASSLQRLGQGQQKPEGEGVPSIPRPGG